MTAPGRTLPVSVTMRIGKTRCKRWQTGGQVECKAVCFLITLSGSARALRGGAECRS